VGGSSSRRASRSQLTGGLDGLRRETLKAHLDVRGAKRPGDVAVVAMDAKAFGDLDLQ
jgi:hypothetical protein